MSRKLKNIVVFIKIVLKFVLVRSFGNNKVDKNYFTQKFRRDKISDFFVRILIRAKFSFVRNYFQPKFLEIGIFLFLLYFLLKSKKNVRD